MKPEENIFAAGSLSVIARKPKADEAIQKTRLLHPFGVRNDAGKTHRLQIITLGFVLFTCFFVTGCYSQNITAIRQDVKELVSLEQESKDPYLWDFGKVQENIILEHEFVFINESKVVINIKDINTSCGCTISEVKQQRLLPGESTVISVKFNSKGYSGAVTQYVYMNTDDIDNSIVRYIIKADVIK